MYVYFIHSATTSVISRTIGLYTRNKYNHVSIAFDQELSEVYSFGRKQPNNPLIAGFVNEDLSAGVFTSASCHVYRLLVTPEEYNKITEMIHSFKGKSNRLRYNLLGLVFLSWRVDIKRSNYYFCSEFASTLLQQATEVSLPKSANFMTPQDLAELPQMELQFTGTIAEYKRRSHNECVGGVEFI